LVLLIAILQSLCVGVFEELERAYQTRNFMEGMRTIIGP